jgi:hypothetical protein
LLQPKLDEPVSPNRLHPDESGWLFLGRSVATGARLRFPSREKIVEYHLHLDRSGMPENAFSSGQQTGVFLKVLSVDCQ